MKRLIKLLLLPAVLMIGAINLSCSDMYSEMLDNMPGNYRLGIFVTTMTMVNYLIISDSDVNLSQKSVFAGYSTGYDGTVADFNRDGNLDMLTVAPDEKPMIAFTDGKGKITHYSDFSLLTSNDHATKTVAADFNNDGATDIFIATDSTIANKVYLNNGDGTFSNGPLWTFSNFNYSDLCSGDFNRDGCDDIMIFSGTTGVTYIYLSNGDGSFSAGQTFPSSNSISDTGVGDLDGDGDIDIIQAVYDSGAMPVNIYKNNGDGTFQVTTGPSYSPGSIALGDIDSDGDLDAYAGTDDGVDLSFLINNGSGSFTQVYHNSAIPASIFSLKMGDIDADGDIDLVAYQSGVLRVYINDGNLVLTRYKDFPVGSIISISIGRFIR